MPLISGLRASLGIVVVQSLLTEIGLCGFKFYFILFYLFILFFKKRTKCVAITGELLQPGRRIREHDSSSSLPFALEAPGCRLDSCTWGKLSGSEREQELKFPSVQCGWTG